MIAESTPFGGIELKQASKSVQKILADKNSDFGDAWDRWYGKVIEIIDKYDISMWCYINADWESQPMWENIGFGETRIATNKIVMAKWQEQIIHSSIPDRKFLLSGTLESCGVHTIDNSDKLENFARDFEWDHFNKLGSFIVIPFLLVSAIFFVPFLILGDGGTRVGRGTKNAEKKHLLADIDQINTYQGRFGLKTSNMTDSTRAKTPSPTPLI